MTDEHTPTLQDMVADRECWSAHAGKHHRELAHWLRGIAAKCRLPYTQKELLKLAKRYDTRADLSVAELLPDNRRAASNGPYGRLSDCSRS